MACRCSFSVINLGGFVPQGRKLHLRGLMLRMAWVCAGLRAEARCLCGLLCPHGRAHGALWPFTRVLANYCF